MWHSNQRLLQAPEVCLCPCPTAAKTALHNFMQSKESSPREKDLFRSVKVGRPQVSASRGPSGSGSLHGRQAGRQVPVPWPGHFPLLKFQPLQPVGKCEGSSTSTLFQTHLHMSECHCFWEHEMPS